MKLFKSKQFLPISYLMVCIQSLKDSRLKIKMKRHIGVTETSFTGTSFTITEEAKESLITESKAFLVLHY